MAGKPILYYFYPSYYSQKTLMFMNEKEIDFDVHIVNLPEQENQSPWFLQINPKGEIPALKHGERIINGSDNILDYIERQKLGKRSLVPGDSSGLKKYKHWMSKLEPLPIFPLTYGTAYHPHIRKVQKGPLIGSRYEAMKNFVDNRSATLRKKAAENAGTPAEAVLLAKADAHDKQLHLFTSEVEHKRILKEIDEMLNQIENELKSHKDKNWLISDEFTAADCILAVLLNRLHWIGHENYVINEKRPLLKKYWGKLQASDTFIKSTYVPNLALYMIKDKISKNAELIFGYALLPIMSGLVYYGLTSMWPK